MSWLTVKVILGQWLDDDTTSSMLKYSENSTNLVPPDAVVCPLTFPINPYIFLRRREALNSMVILKSKRFRIST